MSDKEELTPAEELTTGISVTASDLNILLETRSEHSPGGSYPQIKVNIYKPLADASKKRKEKL